MNGAPEPSLRTFKFSPTGEILMTLGQAWIAGDGPDTFDRPTDIAVNAMATSSSPTGTDRTTGS